MKNINIEKVATIVIGLLALIMVTIIFIFVIDIINNVSDFWGKPLMIIFAICCYLGLLISLVMVTKSRIELIDLEDCLHK